MADEPPRRTDYRSARIGAAIALTLTLIALLVLDVVVPDYDVDPVVMGALVTTIANAPGDRVRQRHPGRRAMTAVTVWSERDEPNAAGWRDCSYAAALMALVAGGFSAFPEGIYTVAEREALERSDDKPDEIGAGAEDITTAVQRRYGLTLRTTDQPLSELLTVRQPILLVSARRLLARA